MTWLYVRPEKRLPLLLTALFLLWVYGVFWWAVGAAAVAYLGWSTYKRLEEQRAADVETARRADMQHNQTMSGDERGVYGTATEAMKNYQNISG